jgi:UDP-glucose 4,6-dehydratase
MRIPDIHTAMAECMQRTKKNLDAQGWKPAPRGQ